MELVLVRCLAMNKSRKCFFIILIPSMVIPWLAVRYLSNQSHLELQIDLSATKPKCNAAYVSNTGKGNTSNNDLGYQYAEMSYTDQTMSLLDEFYFGDKHIAMVLPNQTSHSDLPPYKYTIIDWTMYSNSDWKTLITGNCLVTRNKGLVASSDVIAIVSRKLPSISALPTVRKPWQRWVWILDESPFHPLEDQPFVLDNLRHMFNWTMTYRSDSDVYIPYGYTFRLQKSRTVDDSLFVNKSQLVAAVISNCGTGYTHNCRFTYIKQLEKLINVTRYGLCGIHCAGRLSNGQLASHCPEIEKFKFFLAFENSNCKEYITEKMFIHGLSMGAVPVVMGARKTDYMKLAPPNSLIFAGDFAQPEYLAKYLVTLSNNKTEYMKFHEWRRNFDAKYRTQYYDNFIWTPLCKKLNAVANSFQIQNAWYPSLEKFWDLNRDCDLSKNFL